MMKYTIHLRNDITICTFTGKIVFEEGMNIIIEFYKHPSKHFLWDLRKASLEEVSSDELGRTMDFISIQQSKRPEGSKTALLVSGDLEYGLSRMVQIFAELKEIKIKFNIFRNYNEAIDWLNTEIDPDPEPNPIESYFSIKK